MISVNGNGDGFVYTMTFVNDKGVSIDDGFGIDIAEMFGDHTLSIDKDNLYKYLIHSTDIKEDLVNRGIAIYQSDDNTLVVSMCSRGENTNGDVVGFNSAYVTYYQDNGEDSVAYGTDTITTSAMLMPLLFRNDPCKLNTDEEDSTLPTDVSRADYPWEKTNNVDWLYTNTSAMYISNVSALNSTYLADKGYDYDDDSKKSYITENDIATTNIPLSAMEKETKSVTMLTADNGDYVKADLVVRPYIQYLELDSESGVKSFKVNLDMDYGEQE